MLPSKPSVELVGRSSSHFTRVARIFALELGVPHEFRPVFDITALDPLVYGNNPALKVPVLVDERGPLFGTENICRALVERSGIPAALVTLRGQASDRAVANAEELVLHVMSSEVSLITAKAAGSGHAAPPKVTPSLKNSLNFLENALPATLAALPAERQLSFFEVALYCVMLHLPFREILDTSPWPQLQAFSARFGERESAQATTYRFDKA